MEGRSGQASQRTRTGGFSKRKHPYASFEGSKEWLLIDKALDELVGNGDLEEQTSRPYIIGYLCKALSARNIP
jgi:hypothetical protein